MKEKESTCGRHFFRKLFWSTIAVTAFIKAIEGPNHIEKRKKRHITNKIIYIYK